MVFSQSQLDKIVAETLPADAQPGEKVIVGTVDKTGAQVVAAFKMRRDDFTWELQGIARHDWDGNNSGQGKVILRWQ